MITLTPPDVLKTKAAEILKGVQICFFFFFLS